MLSTSNKPHPFNGHVISKESRPIAKLKADPDAVATRRRIEEFHEKRHLKQELEL